MGNAVFTVDRRATITFYFGLVYKFETDTKTVGVLAQSKDCKNVLGQGFAVTNDGIFISEYGSNKPLKACQFGCRLIMERLLASPTNLIKAPLIIRMEFMRTPMKIAYGFSTGDFEGQCYLYSFNEEFTDLVRYGDGRQDYRAVSLTFADEDIYWGMDSL